MPSSGHTTKLEYFRALVKCDTNKATKMICSSNLLGTGIFLLLSYAVAQVKGKPTNSVTIRQSTGDLCRNHLSGEFVPHPEQCQLFYLCVENGAAVLATCPNTMLFNVESKLCDSAESVRCQNTSRPEDTPNGSNNGIDSMVTDPASYCASLMPLQSNDQIVYIGSSSSCSQFYICYYGQAVRQECGATLHWNAATGQCDLPEQAQCSLQLTEPPTSMSSTVNEFIHCPLYGQHLYPHMQRCDFFIYCVKGHATLQQCPFYYFFDVVTRSCQWSRTALCVRDLNLPHHSQ